MLNESDMTCTWAVTMKTGHRRRHNTAQTHTHACKGPTPIDKYYTHMPNAFTHTHSSPSSVWLPLTRPRDIFPRQVLFQFGLQSGGGLVAARWNLPRVRRLWSTAAFLIFFCGLWLSVQLPGPTMWSPHSRKQSQHCDPDVAFHDAPVPELDCFQHLKKDSFLVCPFRQTTSTNRLVSSLKTTKWCDWRVKQTANYTEPFSGKVEENFPLIKIPDV